jgi:hypothetical protein
MNTTHYTIFTSDFSLVGEPALSAPSSPLASGPVSLATILSAGGGSLARTQEGGASSRLGLGPGQTELQPVVGPATLQRDLTSLVVPLPLLPPPSSVSSTSLSWPGASQGALTSPISVGSVPPGPQPLSELEFVRRIGSAIGGMVRHSRSMGEAAMGNHEFARAAI